MGWDGEDVTNGEGANEKDQDLGDGEADIGDDDGDNKEGDFFFHFLFKGIAFPSLTELQMVSIFLLLYSWIGVVSIFFSY